MIHEKNAFFQKWGKLLLFAGYVLFFACIGWCSPITGDDLEFASLQYETLEEYWTYVSQYGNGRFLGNALGVAMSCLPLLRIWGRAVVLASCVMLLPRALGRDSFGDCWLSFLLLVGVDGKLFGEVYAWAAGFGNYITPIWLTLLILTLLTSRTDVHQGGILRTALIFLLAVCAQLFMEHTAAVNLLLSLYAVVRSFRKKDISPSGAWAWLVGSLIGLGIMLFGPSLFYVPGNHAEKYRALYRGNISEMITVAIRNTLRLSTYYLNANALPICLGGAATLWLTRDRRSARGNRGMAMAWGVCTGYIAFCAFQGMDSYFGKQNFLFYAVSLAVILTLIGIWALAAWQLGSGGLRDKLLLCLALGVIALAPILIVYPLHIRIVFQSYIFFAAAGVLSLSALGGTLEPRFRSWGKSATMLAATAVAVNLLLVYAFIGQVSRLRDDYIREQISQGAQTIQAFTIEYDYVLDDCLDELAVLYYSKLAGYPVTFEKVSQSVWLQWYG